MFQNERLLDALIRADRHQAEQTRRTIEHPGFRKGDVTTNGVPTTHTLVGYATKSSKWGWI